MNMRWRLQPKIAMRLQTELSEAHLPVNERMTTLLDKSGAYRPSGRPRDHQPEDSEHRAKGRETEPEPYPEQTPESGGSIAPLSAAAAAMSRSRIWIQTTGSQNSPVTT